ncbi:MAG: FAD-dependent oxidoreductase [Syntrophales bacterium]|jgi:formate dehydrogenase beta subunit|nr:FAD-dependent oxidoreductase [Syntrophales bacterium]MCK9528309.1 FAD-dependent oxidoreductase [Syntrophales bacterium]MDX9922148.1 FAD-dependent oxidoreductase [Syntrophales bacterium]
MKKIAFSSWDGKIIDNRKGPSSKAKAVEPLFPRLSSGAPASAIMGWNGLVLGDAAADVPALSMAYLKEARKISCGECSVCMLGIDTLLDMMDDLAAGTADKTVLSEMEHIARQAAATSKCAFGRTVFTPFTDALKYFKADFQALAKGDRKLNGGAYGVSVTAPCIEACPAGLDIPGYIELIRNGRFAESLDLIRERCIMPGTIGRACTHPCEAACVRCDLDEPLAIRLLKRAASDQKPESGATSLKVPDREKEENVAVIGAGPAGLAAAYHLRRRGYGVTIFEALPRAGGMGTAGIPEYRVPSGVVSHEVDLIKRTGVKIYLNTKIEKLDMKEFRKKGFKAVFVAVGAHKGNAMGVEGEDEKCEGLVDGVEFLRELNLGKTVEPRKKVVIIGGGNVALDCARSCRRLGFSNVEIIYRRTRKEMPAGVEEVEGALEEGVKITYLAAPVAIIAEKGVFKALECRKMKLGDPDESGRRRPVPVKGSEYRVKADMVISAIGQSPVIPVVGGSKKLDLTKWGTIEADPVTFETSIPGVFAGGDCVLGPATLIEALDAGNRVAASIDAWLQGEPAPRDELSFDGVDFKKRRTTGFVAPEPAGPVVHLDAEERVGGFEEVEGGYSAVQAMAEAKRCLRCYRVVVWSRA